MWKDRSATKQGCKQISSLSGKILERLKKTVPQPNDPPEKLQYLDPLILFGFFRTGNGYNYVTIYKNAFHNLSDKLFTTYSHPHGHLALDS